MALLLHMIDAVPIKIRRANTQDVAWACSVIRKSIAELRYLDHGGDEAYLSKWFLSNKTVENVRRWISQSHFFVAEHEGRIVGVVAMTDSGKITLNYVDPPFRFRGVSKVLMLAIEEHARALESRTAFWKARKQRCGSTNHWDTARASKVMFSLSPGRPQ